MAALLWQGSGSISFASTEDVGTDIYTALARLVEATGSTLCNTSDDVERQACELVGLIATVCGAAPGDDPIHLRLARAWRCGPADAAKLSQALVVMADHDLNASTFATRVAASTGASLAASVLAGLCTLSGPRHGGAGAALRALIERAKQAGVEQVLDGLIATNFELPGFGHPLYPNGDPRCTLLMDGIDEPDHLKRFREAVTARTGLLPNCDFGLTTLVDALDLPQNAPFHLFVIGRAVGWCAHVIE